MSAELVLMRHGQASFGSSNYDALSALGARQCQAVARHWLSLERDWHGLWRGTLDRQRDSLAAVAAMYQAAGRALPEPVIDAGFDEHPGLALMRAHPPADRQRLEALAPADRQRAWFTHYREMMTGWMDGRIGADDIDAWPAVRDRILGALERAADDARAHGGRALVMTSGGVAAIATAHALGLAPERFLDLSLRIGNAARVHLHVGQRNLALLAFNDSAGLDHPELHTFV